MVTYPFTEYTLELHWTWHAYCEVAASTILLYDWTITLDREIDMFWGKRRSWTSILFFINRYMTFVGQSFNTYCKVAISYWLIGFGMAQLLATDTIIYVRICAMYSNKRLHKTLISLLVAATLGSAAIAGAVGSRTKATETPYVGARQCTVTTPYGFLWAFWLPILAYEGLAFYLIAAKALQFIREDQSGWKSSLIQVLLRDSLLYFALIFVLSIANAVLFGGKDPSLAGILEPITAVLLSLMGSRMLLNMQEELVIKEDSDLSTPTTAMGFGVATEAEVNRDTVTAVQA
ncbi:hypothetical protein EXIGLDRAFT_838983 [Exidia glandulosa HHB12029]|uniref:DUF6533 domain-containing protein n=1 Tax=Exidia glandulosa HHB12029 TaxID=1314781 RepID=A0A165FD75_EXIGL|nr:hypothetical protein EXIGLDRAFT_838983 [Exidia glandulosa HHB12029]